MARLNNKLLQQLKQIEQPRYDREQLQPGIVHLGIGAFHRAHQAFYTEQVMNQVGGQWGIIGCSLRSNTVSQQLAPQDGLYTLLQRGAHNHPQIIGSVVQVLVGPEDPQAVIDAVAAETTKIISLTITEKGYCHQPSNGQLNNEHPDIQHDLNHPLSPKTAVGYLIAGLNQRRKSGGTGVTLLSCDNLPNNGQVLRNVVKEFAQRVSPDLAQWIIEQVTFPCTMIDRIVPATTEDDIHALETEYGYTDQALVVAEPFTQWVIEDNFAQGRPQWELTGALLVPDVAAYENIKLRLLNGSHSLLAYTGYLAGAATIYEVMQNPTLVRLCQSFMATAAATLTVPDGFDVKAYQAQLVERFGNPGLQHRTWQIAMDGSQKLPQRWLHTLHDLLQQEQNPRLFALALAAWMRYISGTDEQGQTIDVSDPMRDTFAQLHQTHAGNCDAYVEALFQLPDIFDEDLASNSAFKQQVSEMLERINAKGVLAVVEQVLTEG